MLTFFRSTKLTIFGFCFVAVALISQCAIFGQEKEPHRKLLILRGPPQSTNRLLSEDTESQLALSELLQFVFSELAIKLSPGQDFDVVDQERVKELSVRFPGKSETWSDERVLELQKALSADAVLYLSPYTGELQEGLIRRPIPLGIAISVRDFSQKAAKDNWMYVGGVQSSVAVLNPPGGDKKVVDRECAKVIRAESRRLGAELASSIVVNLDGLVILPGRYKTKEGKEEAEVEQLIVDACIAKEKGNLAAAEKALTKALSEANFISDRARLYSERAQVFELEKRVAEAEKDLSELVRLNGSRTEDLRRLAFFLERTKQNSKAEAIWNQIVNIESSQKFYRSEFFERIGNVEKAADDLDSMIEDNHSSGSYYYRGLFAERTGNIQEALNNYQRANKIQTNNPKKIAALVRAEYKLGENSKASETAKEGFLLTQSSDGNFASRAELALLAGHFQDALKLLKKAPDNSESAAMIAALAQEALGQPESKQICLQKALENYELNLSGSNDDLTINHASFLAANARKLLNGTATKRTNDLHMQLAINQNTVCWAPQITNKFLIIPENIEEGIVGRQMAIIIGTDEYDNFPELKNAVSDAIALSEELKSHYGWDCKVLNCSRQQIRAELRALGAQKFQQNDQVLVYFSGHAVYDEVGKIGYLVMRDSPKDDYGLMYSFPELRDQLDGLDCSHVLVCLDVCHAGTFCQYVAREAVKQRGVPVPSVASRQKAKEIMAVRSRKMLCASKTEPVSDGRSCSPFSGKLLNTLRNCDSEHTTFSAISESLNGLTPTPFAAGFGTDVPGSNFLFQTKH